MSSNPQITPAEDAGSRWPKCSIFSFGTFGGRSPAVRRYHRRCAIALIFMAGSFFGAAIWSLIHGRSPTLEIGLALVPGASFAFIAREFRIYLASLDELARRIQLEAIAWTYLTGMAIAALVGGIALFFGDAWNPLWLNPLWFLFLEPVRSCWLYFIARRY
jgi:hypothetical protein